MPKCAIEQCNQARDLNGGYLCAEHRRWTALLMRRCVEAIEKAIADEDGLDGREGETLLRELGYWPRRVAR